MIRVRWTTLPGLHRYFLLARNATLMTRNSRISGHSLLQLHEMGRSVVFFDAIGESSDYFLLQTQFVYIFVYLEKISRPLLDVKLTRTGGIDQQQPNIMYV